MFAVGPDGSGEVTALLLSRPRESGRAGVGSAPCGIWGSIAPLTTQWSDSATFWLREEQEVEALSYREPPPGARAR
jgi:hypothetical protein